MDHCLVVTKEDRKDDPRGTEEGNLCHAKELPSDLVTETDQKVEALIISSLKEKYPTHR
uniref:Uncharacterized protein n=1 Tax=Anguilla anguilla TaxID=7936 RepID=A0A0E9S522_ANGAN